MSSFDKISISGKIASGKTTLAEYLVKENSYVRISSAKYLKIICELIANRNLFLSVDKNADVSNFNRKLHYYLELISNNEVELKKIISLVDKLAKYFSHVTSTTNKTDETREMLQVVANVLLNDVNEDIWVGSIIKDVHRMKKELGQYKFVHDDLRYPHEYEVLREEGFVFIRLNVGDITQSKRIKKMYGEIESNRLTHISETALDNYSFDYYLHTDKDLEDTLEDLRNIIKE